MEESNKDEVRHSPRLDKFKQMKINEASLRKSPRLELEKGKNKVNLDSDDDFEETNKTKRKSPRLKQTQLMFKTLKQDEDYIVDENGMSPKKSGKALKNPGESCALKKPGMGVIVVKEKKGMKKKKLQRKISQDIDIPNQSGCFRSCPISMVSITENMKETLLSSHKEAMMNTPFGRFFNLFLENRIRSESMANQNKNLLFDIIHRYSVEEDAFKFGEGENTKFVKFTPKHVALTFGLPLHGRKVAEVFRQFKFDPDRCSFLVKHKLQGCGDIKRNVMKSKIEGLMKEEGKANDFCRMIILFMSATIFFPNSNNSIGKSFCDHLENFENMRKIGWTELIYNQLMNKVKTKKDNPIYCACVIPLLVWFCEITGVIKPRAEYIDGTPRIGKWDFTKLSNAWKNGCIVVQNIATDKIKDDFQNIVAEEELLFEEVNIQLEDDKPKDYEQLC